MCSDAHSITLRIQYLVIKVYMISHELLLIINVSETSFGNLILLTLC